MIKLLTSISFLFALSAATTYAATLEQEVKSCKGAWEAVKKHDYQKAVKLADVKKCPRTTTYVTWKKLRDDNIKSSFNDYFKFATAHPQWPWMPVLRRKAEENLADGISNQDILTLFGNEDPKTARGSIFFLKALKSPEKAKKIARHAWHNFSFSENDQKLFLSKYGNYLTADDHHLRFENLCYEGKKTQAERMINLLSKKDLPWAKARLAFLGNTSNPKKIYDQFKNPPHDLIYDCALWHKQNDQLVGAYLITTVPAKHTTNENWWKIRSYFARESLNQNNAKLSYEVMAGHPFKEGENYADAEWFCGWVALRYLNKPSLALKHFQNYQKAVSIPPSKAKADYWLARTYDALKSPQAAKEHYKKAASHPLLYYGILANQELGQQVPVKAKTDKPIPAEKWQKFQNHEFVQIARLLKKAGLADEAETFLYLLGKRAKNREEQYMALKVVREVKSHYTIFATKHIGFHETEAFSWLFPRTPINEQVKQQGVDHHLLSAIAKQESGFNPRIVSPAGAVGLMQVMPSTASKIASSNSYKHKDSRLKDDPTYNVLLGAHFIKEQLKRFDGNLILALSAYNAGPRPVLKWIEKFGDPRDSSVDSIDWVERIPFKETRSYVKSVLAYYDVYKRLES